MPPKREKQQEFEQLQMLRPPSRLLLFCGILWPLPLPPGGEKKTCCLGTHRRHHVTKLKIAVLCLCGEDFPIAACAEHLQEGILVHELLRRGCRGIFLEYPGWQPWPCGFGQCTMCTFLGDTPPLCRRQIGFINASGTSLHVDLHSGTCLLFGLHLDNVFMVI